MGGTTAPVPTPAAGNITHLPEVESLQVELHKDNQGKEIFLLDFKSLVS